MAQHGKKYRAALEKIEEGRKYSLDEGLSKVREVSAVTARKFDETVELTMWLGVDPRKADQLVRGTVVLPHALGKVLGPRGLMPNPKTGTVTFDVRNAVRETKAGKVEYRVDKTGVIHVGIGKVSFEPDKLRENAQTLLDAVVKAKPSTAKGKYVKKVNVAATMSPGVLLDETVYAR